MSESFNTLKEFIDKIGIWPSILVFSLILFSLSFIIYIISPYLCWILLLCGIIFFTYFFNKKNKIFKDE